ncbi:hypothetical protein [Demequina salsinemoris]|uniref:hypothetical protein n=1 Tax=Demequina salsinemoris TaxID=577470 RepID=UPI0007830EE1|nr:hypothetical protein [Demequina salsinemoris]
MARRARGAPEIVAKDGFAIAFKPRGEVTTYVDGGAAAAILLGALAIVVAGVAVTVVSVVALRSRPRPPQGWPPQGAGPRPAPPGPAPEEPDGAW